MGRELKGIWVLHQGLIQWSWSDNPNRDPAEDVSEI